MATYPTNEHLLTGSHLGGQPQLAHSPLSMEHHHGHLQSMYSGVGVGSPSSMMSPQQAALAAAAAHQHHVQGLPMQDTETDPR